MIDNIKYLELLEQELMKSLTPGLIRHNFSLCLSKYCMGINFLLYNVNLMSCRGRKIT